MDYLAIGHVARDLVPHGARLGGTVAFSALTAQALGLSAAVVTSAPDDFLELMSPLGDIAIHRLPTDTATTFENSYSPAGRSQRIVSRAAPLSFDDIPLAWRHPAIVHLAPIADEIDPALAQSFPDSLMCVTPQGWMRQWDQLGVVSFKRWANAPRVLPHTHALVMSVEDAGGDESLILEFARQTPVLAATRGKDGCTVHVNGELHHVSAPPVAEVDPTGAGDIFAATFFARFHATYDAISAAREACAIAADSVTRRGLDGVPKRKP